MISLIKEVRSAETPDMGITEIAKVLSNERRCLAIRALAEHGECDLSDLLETILEWKGETPPCSDVRQNERISLHQHHLPQLDDSEVVDYDHQRTTIRKGPEFEGVLRIQKILEDEIDEY